MTMNDVLLQLTNNSVLINEENKIKLYSSNLP